MAPPPSFFKILIDASAPNLPLPHYFVGKYLKDKIPKAPIIQCANGGHFWKLKIEKVDGNYCFTHGWNNVVKDIDLGFGDFMVFQFVDKSTFKMLVFSPNGCEKDLPTNIKVQHDDVDDDIDGDDGDPSFMSIISRTHIRVLRLPKEFVGLPGINGGKTIKMKNLDGEEWPMMVKLDKSYRGSTRYYSTSGWPNFKRSNKLSEGDECVFKFTKSENKLCLAKVTKKIRSEDECAKVVKLPHGRPFERKKGVMQL